MNFFRPSVFGYPARPPLSLPPPPYTPPRGRSIGDPCYRALAHDPQPREPMPIGPQPRELQPRYFCL